MTDQTKTDAASDKAARATAEKAAKEALDRGRAALSSGISSKERTEAAKAAGCNPEEVIGFKRYEDRLVVVVHDAVSVRKVEVPAKAA